MREEEPRLRDAQGNEPWMDEGEARGDLRWLAVAAVLGVLFWVGLITWWLA